MAQEVNFDGLIGPTHNYAGLSHGNVASNITEVDRSAGEAAYWLARGHMAAGDKTAAREALLRAVEILKASSLHADVRRAQDAQTMVAKL